MNSRGNRQSYGTGRQLQASSTIFWYSHARKSDDAARPVNRCTALGRRLILCDTCTVDPSMAGKNEQELISSSYWRCCLILVVLSLSVIVPATVHRSFLVKRSDVPPAVSGGPSKVTKCRSVTRQPL